MSLSNLGQLLTVGEGASPDALNAGRVIRATGTYIASIPSTEEVPLALCTADGGGLLANWLYQRVFAEEGYSWTPVFKVHYHDNTSEGELYDIYLRNFHKFRHLFFNGIVGNFLYATAGTGNTSENIVNAENTPLRLKTGTAVNDAITAYIASIKVNFAYPHLTALLAFAPMSTSQLIRIGVGMERADLADDLNQKVGMEGCGASGNTWLAVSANGINRNAEDTLDGLAQSNSTSYYIQHVPGVAMYYKSGVGVSKTKTTNVAADGIISRNRQFRAGIKATAASTQRELNLFYVEQIIRSASIVMVAEF